MFYIISKDNVKGFRALKLKKITKKKPTVSTTMFTLSYFIFNFRRQPSRMVNMSWKVGLW